jgi:hypothetical protein
MRGNLLDVIEKGDSPANEKIAAAAQGFRKAVSVAMPSRQPVRIAKEKVQPMDQQALHMVLALLKLGEETAQNIESIFRTKTSNDKKDLSSRKEIETELLFLGLHLLDRGFFEIYGAGQRSLLMDSVMKKLWEIMTYEVPPAKAQEIGSGLITRANAAQEQYSVFKIICPKEGMQFGGTLLWEFTKGVAIKYCGDYRTRTTIFVYGEVLAFSASVQGLLDT